MGAEPGQSALADLIARADETALAASGLGCLDRCLPLLGSTDQVLRPLWVSLADGTAWEGALAEVRQGLRASRASHEGFAPASHEGSAPASREGSTPASREGSAPDSSDRGAATALARRMLDAVPAARSAGALRSWADTCSATALRIHRLLDAGDDAMAPLVAAELRRQIRVLELLEADGDAVTGNLRQVLDVSTEGRRVLRAVVSRSRRSGTRAGSDLP
ncbi:hypothetical protein [Streptomyces sp. NPDC017940]|uniref:hypothetical protein n=1 Tax=Streptomyces sp. NPDC017940 TaxID=3365017 RepID=UPI00379C551C